ncbi:hypothetical protein Tco_0671281 [Tanacetum coccineum]
MPSIPKFMMLLNFLNITKNCPKKTPIKKLQENHKKQALTSSNLHESLPNFARGFRMVLSWIKGVGKFCKSGDGGAMVFAAVKEMRWMVENFFRWQSQAPRHHGDAPAQTRSERVLEKPNEPSLLEGYTSRSGEDSMEYHFELTDNVPPIPHDSPFSGGNTPKSDDGRMELIKELMETCTSLTKRVLALEEAKTAQDRVINRLKLRVKRLEKKRKARTPQPIKRRLFKGRVETSTDTSLGEDASKQGRSSDKTKPMFKDSDFDVLDAEQITTTGPSHVSTADQVSTARPEVSAATPSTPPTTATVFDDEDVTMAMAQTLIKMKEVKAKEKGVEFRNVEEASKPIRSITILQPLPKIHPKDKGKSVLVEEDPKKRQEEATNAALTEEFDEIQARIDADALFAAKFQ